MVYPPAMVEVRWLDKWIILFSMIGSLLSGSLFMASDSPPGEPAPDPLPRVVIELRAIGPDAALSEAEALAVMRVLAERFPGVEVTQDTAPTETPSKFTLRGPMEGSDSHLTQLATASGQWHLQIQANAQDARELGLDLSKEVRRAEACLKDSPYLDLARFNELAHGEGGSPDRIRFGLEPTGNEPEVVPLVIEKDEDWRFDRSSIARVFPSFDRNGRPALGFDITPERQRDFEVFTDEHVGEQLAIMVGTRILTRPVLNASLRTGGIITGGSHGFTQDEVHRYVRVLSSPELPASLKVVSIERHSR